jgi:uncharacterized membrane protein YobD (UPF0266 family)
MKLQKKNAFQNLVFLFLISILILPIVNATNEGVPTTVACVAMVIYVANSKKGDGAKFTPPRR